MVGQDKSTFHQFIFSKKQWKGPNGKESLMPKSEGEIYKATCLAIITKPWKLKTEEKKSRLLSETRKSKSS
jgi:hypothetical protein